MPFYHLGVENIQWWNCPWRLFFASVSTVYVQLTWVVICQLPSSGLVFLFSWRSSSHKVLIQQLLRQTCECWWLLSSVRCLSCMIDWFDLGYRCWLVSVNTCCSFLRLSLFASRLKMFVGLMQTFLCSIHFSGIRAVLNYWFLFFNSTGVGISILSNFTNIFNHFFNQMLDLVEPSWYFPILVIFSSNTNTHILYSINLTFRCVYCNVL